MRSTNLGPLRAEILGPCGGNLKEEIFPKHDFQAKRQLNFRRSRPDFSRSDKLSITYDLRNLNYIIRRAHIAPQIIIQTLEIPFWRQPPAVRPLLHTHNACTYWCDICSLHSCDSWNSCSPGKVFPKAGNVEPLWKHLLGISKCDADSSLANHLFRWVVVPVPVTLNEQRIINLIDGTK